MAAPVTVPGVLGARCFVAIEGQQKYLTLYEFEGSAGRLGMLARVAADFTAGDGRWYGLGSWRRKGRHLGGFRGAAREPTYAR
jgi:hypothetical protein